MAGKRIGPASLSGSSDPYAEARRVNSTSRDALPALPLGDVGYGAPTMDAGGARYATSDEIPPPAPKGDGGLAGPSEPSMSAPKGMQGTVAAPKQAQPRQLSPQELSDMANRMLDSQASQHQAQMGAGPSVGARDDAGGKIPDWLAQEMKRDERR